MIIFLEKLEKIQTIQAKPTDYNFYDKHFKLRNKYVRSFVTINQHLQTISFEWTLKVKPT